jgi:UDP-N-acetylmuramyl pentapeptide synthase
MQNYDIINNSIPKHLAVNIGAIFAASQFLGLDLRLVASNLENYKPIKGRGMESEISYDSKIIKLIDDSYNANPASMKAALDNLASKNAHRKIAIISDMRELGEAEIEFHREIGKYINQINIDAVITFGSLSKYIFDVLDDSKKLEHFSDKNTLQNKIKDILKDGDFVMLKGSKSTLMYEIAEFLISHCR